MKKLLVLLIFVCVHKISSQTYLEGQFVLEIKSPMHGEHYIFNKNGTFEYYEWSDLLPNDYGRGNYEIQDSVLLLNYIDIPEMHDTILCIDNEYQRESDTIIYNIQVYDFKTKLLIQYGGIRLWFKHNYVDTLNKSVFLIEDYKSELVEFSKNNLPEFMRISSLFGGSFIYNVKDSLSRNLRVYLKDMTIALDYIGPKQEKISI